MKTKRTIVNGALGDLRITSAGDSPSAEDYDEAARRYDALLFELRDIGLCYWTNTNSDTEEIPDSLEVPLINLLSARCARMFGKEEGAEFGEDGRPVPQSVAALRALRRHMSKRTSGEATPFSSY